MLLADNLPQLLEILPEFVSTPLKNHPFKEELIEIVLDIGRRPEARFANGAQYLSYRTVVWKDLEYILKRLGKFSGDNRAGIEKTLHRVSALRNRKGGIIGLTCRIGRAIFGTVSIVCDLLEKKKSILLLGRPGVGKTTAIREIARFLSDELKKRVIIIDTSNEIGGDGDLPHPSIGKARRMQVGNPQSQHQIMIEAVENHMPEIIIIDEIGTELEAAAARTIAERGVQLVGTAHGRTLDNLIKNPVLADLIGGIQYVTLGDEEAKRRGSSKSIIERQAAPTFDIGVEIHNPKSWVIHENIGVSIDLLLQGQALALQKREIGKVNKNFIQCKIISSQPELEQLEASTGLLVTDKKQKNNALLSRFTQYEYIKFKKVNRTKTKIAANRFIFLYAYGINGQDLLSLIKILNLPIILTREIQYADAILALGNLIKNNKKLRQISTVRNISVSSVPNNNLLQLAKALKQIVYKNKDVTKLKNRTIRLQHLGSAFLNPTEEVQLVINEITLLHKRKVNLLPQSYIVRKLQHEQIMLLSLRSKSVGDADDLNKRVRIYDRFS
jgi:stage III sporulation protein SpoIIIAA